MRTIENAAPFWLELPSFSLKYQLSFQSASERVSTRKKQSRQPAAAAAAVFLRDKNPPGQGNKSACPGCVVQQIGQISSR